MKYLILVFCILFSFSSLNAQLLKKKTEKEVLDSAQVSNQDISNALKITLKEGVDDGTKTLKKQKKSLFDLGNSNANFSSDLVKVIQTVSKLQNMDLVDELQKLLNRSANGILNTSEPVFNQAINQINFGDAYRILMAGDNAATQFVKEHAGPEIESALSPKIESILQSGGVLDKWNEIQSAYNKLTGENVNINLADDITQKIVTDMFNQIALEEVKVRMNDYLRTSLLLKAVFSLQDVKIPAKMKR